ncbi:hypothetical protein DRN72_00400 [Methanosarcinales archaeon]|nr:MAG: hypothetical protein DRN72_00400 [Methanosarcinales archaeon]
MKTIEEINEKIRDGNVNVVDALEMCDIVEELGAEKAAKEVDVVTTGTFGAMCSSGMFFNLGHADPPIKISRMWLNDVEAYAGIAAVDGYLGVTQISETKGLEYGGGHVIEELVEGKSVELRAEGFGTDCYPSRRVTTEITLADMNQTIMLNPRNSYQRYNAATNSTERVLYTYMGTLLPDYGNITYSGAGALSPLCNDPNFDAIGIGTRIFLCGAKGYIIGEGTQHDPENNFATLMVKGDLKEMSTEFLRAAVFTGYGTSLYVGIGVPIPVLNEKIASNCGVRDCDIETNVLDYGIGRRKRPILRKVTYEELKSGSIELFGREVKCSSLSSIKKAEEIAKLLAKWIKKGEFLLTPAVESLPRTGSAKPMKLARRKKRASQIMSRQVVVVRPSESIRDVAKNLIKGGFNHLPVVSEDDKLVGIITSWDISKAVANGLVDGKVEDIMTTKVVCAVEDDPIETVAHKLKKYKISAVPVVDSERHVIGMITSEDISKLLAKGE